MAAELKLVEPTQIIKLIHSRDHLLSSEPLPAEFTDRTLQLLKDAGVEVILGERVISKAQVEDDLYKLTLENGTHIMAGSYINAISASIPATSYLPDDILDHEGFVIVTPS
jgi:hypothetical protein